MTNPQNEGSCKRGGPRPGGASLRSLAPSAFGPVAVVLVPSQGTASGTLSVALALLITMLVFGGAALLALLIAWWGGPEGPPNGPEQTE